VPLSSVEIAPTPVNPATNPETPQPTTPPAASSVNTGPSAAAQQADPYSGLAGTNGSATEISASSINTSTTATDPNAGISSADLGTTAYIAPTPAQDPYAGVQKFDDGSTLQTFDDGSTLATGSDGSLSSSNAPADTSAGSPATAELKGQTDNAFKQPGIADQTGQEASTTDWRLRISLAKGATYLYNADPPGILQPLKPTNGVIFPYTPKIDMGYKANYSNYDLTHSNYRGYFYQSSSISDISITGHFTAQNTAQANYLLAVIHFFRSATKMFYGQDAQRGSPPPLVFMSGLGQYQFNNHPCLITEFSYNLPEDVDYIRASVVNNVGLNASTISNVLNSGVAAGKITGNARLAAAFTTPGALPNIPFGSPNTPNNASGAPTYVPTKMDIVIKLYPVQSRQQVSKQFSLKGFANGNLLKGGFW
jgi:hypothetical protein